VRPSIIIPKQFTEPLQLTADVIASQQICQLSELFNHWLKEIFDTVDTHCLVEARAQFVDCVLTKLWCQHQLDEFQLALHAVGGYGRGELHPHSDIDILLLIPESISTALEERISAFITQLWDVRLDVGHSVRSVKECLKQAVNDVTVATNLMEIRHITGTTTLAEQLQPLLHEDVFWTSEKFFIAKRDEQLKRHQQYHGASYTLEPNLKENPGGLRDIQTIAWVAKRHFKAESLEELVQHDYLTLNEYFELLECQDYLWRMRFALHFVAGRSENRLLFDYQADVAELLGFGDKGKAAVERMMKRFFRIIARVAELNTMLLQHFEQAILPSTEPVQQVALNEDFELIDGLINVTNTRVFMRSVKIMEMFLIIAQHDEIKGLHSNTLRLLRNARRRLISGLCDYAESRRIFLEIVRHPRGFGLTLTLMHKYSIIGAYLPLWRNIVGQMQFDLFHAYSVDEHSYRLLKNLHRFSQVEHNHEFPLCSKIVQRIRKPELLSLAGIFHDIAKGRGGDHAELGAIDALSFCQTHNINDHDARMVAWLVKNHLLMSVTAQRRDITDENVIKTFGEVVRDEAHLDYLYCLTVADMRATNETLWNSWKANLLEELYFTTKRALRRGLEKPVDLKAKIRENQTQALEFLAEVELDAEQIKTFWKEFKADYFLRYSPAQIAWHTQHIMHHDRSKPLVLINAKPYRGGTEVFIFTKEVANIFALSVALLTHRKLSIHDAKIITSKTGYTVNTFVILDHRNKAIDDSYRANDIAKTITYHIAQNKAPNLKKLKLPARYRQFKFPCQVGFIKSHAKNRTMIEIVALDRPGLLETIARVFQRNQVSIHTAKITTFGEKAEDVFTISNELGSALTEAQQRQLAHQLADTIDSYNKT
jgi:[protein-PII] uridylyltransferase